MTALDRPVDVPHPIGARRAPRRGRLAALVRFGVTGFLSIGMDVAILYVLHSVAHVELILATTVAYLSSLGVNYSLNHAWVFQADGQTHRRLLRYGILVVVNYLSIIGFVSGLTALGLYYLFAKLVAVAVNAVINFTGFRYWVFK